MSTQEYLVPIDITTTLTHEFGEVFVVPRHYSHINDDWFELNMSIEQLLLNFIGPELAEQILNEIRHPRTMNYHDSNTVQGVVGKSAPSGGRKFYLPLIKGEEKYERAIRLIRILIKRYVPNYPYDESGNLILPDTILLAIKGSGNDEGTVALQKFGDNELIYGYSAVDRKDVFLSHLLIGLHTIDGQSFNLIPNRIHLGSVMLDAVSTREETIRLDIDSDDLPLASGDNQLAVSAIVEPYGPDMSANINMFVNTGIVHRARYLKEHLSHHPFFAKLCERGDLSPVEWVELYFIHLIKHAYLFTRVAARWSAIGDNRTVQNTGLTGLPQDLDDNIVFTQPIADESPEYLTNFSAHFIAQLKVINSFARSFASLNMNKIYSEVLQMDISSPASLLAQYCLVSQRIKYNSRSDIDRDCAEIEPRFEEIHEQIEMVFALPQLDTTLLDQSTMDFKEDHFFNRAKLVGLILDNAYSAEYRERTLGLIKHLIAYLEKLSINERKYTTIEIFNMLVTSRRLATVVNVSTIIEHIESLFLNTKILDSNTRSNILISFLNNGRIPVSYRMLIFSKFTQSHEDLISSDPEFTEHLINRAFVILERSPSDFILDYLSAVDSRIDTLPAIRQSEYKLKLAKLYFAHYSKEAGLGAILSGVLAKYRSKNTLRAMEYMQDLAQYTSFQMGKHFSWLLDHLFTYLAKDIKDLTTDVNGAYYDLVEGFLFVCDGLRDDHLLRELLIWLENSDIDWPQKQDQIKQIQEMVSWR